MEVNMKSTVKNEAENVEPKLGRSRLPGKSILRNLVDTTSSSTNNAYVEFYNYDVKETEDASKTLKRLHEKTQAVKYAKYKL
jgi:hypothetical protein